VIGRVLLLIGGSLAFCLLTALPARHLGGGDLAVLYSGTTVLLCLVPAVATLLWSALAEKKNPQQVPLVVLGGTGVRMFGVLLAAWFLYTSLPVFREQAGFWTWLLVNYLFILALEMALLLGGRTRPVSQPGP